ncbi:uncharacterized protein DUF1080 [Salegentibacter sp. 24]|uniref:3-keto-disaccharide hydrolase n=1 Tax=Salegentibacter sp. 24 TaxID=2183986 RepID=UPI00105C2080|nr:DUF1080 domain-containing protein [Salegentibacter sp. 24]TDN95093.1 uncharacterized protein DUF1080 [Salegentibacter sp. 24]
MKSKISLLLLSLSLSLSSCKLIKEKKEDSNEPREWISLFNGKNLENWTVKVHGHETGDNYAKTFRVVDSVIQVNYDDYTEFNERYAHLFYKEPFSSYHLKFKYRFTPQWMEDAPSYTYRNSGVMFHSQPPETILKDQDWPISVEFQMLAQKDENEARPTGNMCSPGTEVYYQSEMDPRHCINSSSKTYNWNQWVNAELIVYSDSLVIHKINGKKVLEYTKPQIGGGVANGYDPKIKIDGKPLTSGYIGLQAEGQGVEFSDIMIKNLD